MSRYDIAIDKKEGNFQKIKKAISKKGLDLVTRSGKVSGVDTTARRGGVDTTARRGGVETPTGGEQSTEFIRLVNMMRGGMASNGVQGETGVSMSQGPTGIGVQGETGALEFLGYSRIGNQGETGIYAERAPGLRIESNNPAPGVGIYVTGGPIPLQIASQSGNVGFGMTPTQRVPEELTITDGAVASQADGTITTRVPVSRFLTLTGPNGDRIMIPLRMLNYRIDDEHGEKRISIKLSDQQARSLNSDILQGIRRTAQ